MYKVMFFNRFGMLVFGENREGKFLGPCGTLLESSNGLPSSVTEFLSFEEAELFSRAVLEQYGGDLKATIHNAENDIYKQIL